MAADLSFIHSEAAKTKLKGLELPHIVCSLEVAEVCLLIRGYAIEVRVAQEWMTAYSAHLEVDGNKAASLDAAPHLR